MSKAGKSLSRLMVFGQLLLLSGAAHAAEDPAAAEALFQEGRRLLADGKVSIACEKFKESFALDAMSGTLLNLAACYEQDGKTATAWARFRNAASLAKSQGKAEQAAEANRRVKAIESELSYMTVVVAEPVPGLEVKRNDAEVTAAMFGVEVPVDPGHVEVVASAPGHKPVRLTVEVGARRDKQTVTIPKLAVMDKAELDKAAVVGKPEAGAATAAESGLPKGDEKSTLRAADAKDEGPPKVDEPIPIKDGPGIVPWIIGGVGIAAAATGGVFGFMAMKSDELANNKCPTHYSCSKSAVSAAQLRDEQALVADITVGVGVAAIATAAIWLLVDRPKRHDDASAALLVRPAVARDAAGLSAVGRF